MAASVLKVSYRSMVVLTTALIGACVALGLTEMVFEAAFQGECREDSPCQHLCFDLHDGTFECACKDGYTLANNGYSCLENSKIEADDNTTLIFKSNSTLDGSFNQTVAESSSTEYISVTHEEERRSRQPQSLAQVKGEDDGDDEDDDSEDDWNDSQDDSAIQFDFQTLHVDGTDSEQIRQRILDSGIYRGEVDTDGRSPPSTASSDAAAAMQVMGSQTSVPTTTPISDHLDDHFQPMNTVTVTTPPSRMSYHTCSDLECESGGVCIQGTVDEGARCRCPIGRGGFFCERPVEIRFPRFLGDSYLAFPVLRDAHKSMQVTLDFRPETHDGILLYSGEKQNLEGDFMALLLDRGFVEFRFDCGMGEGILRSDQPVILHSWNTVTIYRDRWNAWMQLNSGKQIQGRSKGLFSRITFRLNLFLGGSPNTSLVADRLQTNLGFQGCIRHMEINSVVYSFKAYEPKTGPVAGVNIEECNSDVCSQIICRNGGQCVPTSPDHGVCLCGLGFAGDQCETEVDISLPYFNGSSYLQYPGLGNSVLSFVEIYMVFKPQQPNGVLLYNGYKMDGTGDFLSINLIKGFVEFRFDLGTGVAVIRSLEPITMNEWHTVFISRTGRDGILEVDDQVRQEGMSPGAFTQLSLPLNLFMGGVPDLKDVSRKAKISKSFVGCIQKVVINNRPVKLLDDALSGINVADCSHPCVEKPCNHGGGCEPNLDFYSCHCMLGYAGTNCEREVTEQIAVPMFSGNSYLHFDDDEINRRIRGNKLDIRLRFKAFTPDCLILWAGEKEMTGSSDFLAIGMKNGFIQMQYNLGSGEALIVLNATRVDDGKWHTLEAFRYKQEASIKLNDGYAASGLAPGSLNQLNVNNGLFLGGMEDIVLLSRGKYKMGLVGCLANFTLSTDYHVRLVTHATRGINIQPCM